MGVDFDSWKQQEDERLMQVNGCVSGWEDPENKEDE